jgi:hypothetical protein
MESPLIDEFRDNGREVSVTLDRGIITQFKDIFSIPFAIEVAPRYCPRSLVVVCSSIVGMLFKFLLHLSCSLQLVHYLLNGGSAVVAVLQERAWGVNYVWIPG